MANISALQGGCIAPFLDESLFPQAGGHIAGRFCAPISMLPHDPTCCLPCPATEWMYPDSFNTYGRVAEWLNVAGLILIVFMLVSYVVLPAQQTRSHYLSVCLIVAVGMIAIGFTIPLGANPEQCYDAITPNDMYSSMECAWSGAFIIAGGLCASMWIFIRALSMNLQICWDIVPGRKFFYVSQGLGWGIPAALFAATMTVTGVSFRFGSACHVNHETSMADFWGPLMAIAGAAGILQLMTFGYCIHVYLKNLWTDQAQNSTTASGSGLPCHSGSVRTQTARAVYQRLKKVLWLQWRGICIVTIILVDVVFFSIVFVYLDGLQNAVLRDWTRVEPWLLCLALNPTDKSKCTHLTDGWLVNEQTVVAVLILLSLAGIQSFLFLTRPSVFSAWADFFRNRFSPRRQEFVSLDARPDAMQTNSNHDLLRYTHERGHQSTTFEMQKPGHYTKGLNLDIDSKTLSPTQTLVSSPDEAYRSPLHYGGLDAAPEYDADRRSLSPASTMRGGMPADYNFGHPTARPTSPPFNAFAQQQQRQEQQHTLMNPSASPPTPAVSYNSISLHRQPSDYFTQQQQQQQPRRPYARENSNNSVPQTQAYPRAASAGTRSPDSAQHEDNRQRGERRYNPPTASFSAPKTPSRQSSQNSTHHNITTYDPRDLYSRGGLALNPPSEAGESAEDLTLDASHRVRGREY